MSGRADVGIVGAGIVGLCTAQALREQGVSVRVYESAVPGNGQSGGESRIFRHAHDDPRLVAMARDSLELWREWEDRFGVELVSRDGAVAIGPSVEDRLAVLDAVGGVPVRRIDAAELAEWLPALAPYEGPAMLDEGAGAIRIRAAIGALAGELGDDLVAEEVLSLRHLEGGDVEVRAGGMTAEHATVVVCAGRGTAALARGAGLSLPVRLAAHVRLTFAVSGGAPPGTLACLQDTSGAWGETGVYAAPTPGNTHYAVGLSSTVEGLPDGALLDPDDLGGHATRVAAYVGRALPGLDPEPVDVRHCWVTDLPWSADGVGVWEAGPVLFCAGHNLFKQAPGLGRSLARAATGGGLAKELRPAARLGAPPVR